MWRIGSDVVFFSAYPLLQFTASQLCTQSPINILIFNQAVLIMLLWRHFYYCCVFCCLKIWSLKVSIQRCAIKVNAVAENREAL